MVVMVRVVIVLIGFWITYSANTPVAIAGGDKKADSSSKSGGGGGDGPSLDSIKSGRLARYGITAGIAIAAYAPSSKWWEDNRQSSWGVSAMPYLEAYPMMIGLGNISRAYCVARNSSSNAQSVADKVAISEAGFSLGGLDEINSTDGLSENDETVLLRSKIDLGKVEVILNQGKMSNQEKDRGLEEIQRITSDINLIGHIAAGELWKWQLESLRAPSLRVLVKSYDTAMHSVVKLDIQDLQVSSDETKRTRQAAFLAHYKFVSTLMTELQLIVQQPPTDGSFSKQDIDDINEDIKSLAASQTILTRAAFESLGAESKKMIVSWFVNRITGWTLGNSGAGCWRTSFGVYAGLPATFNADGHLTGSYISTDYKPLYSAGITFGWLSEVRLMAGLTVSRFAEPIEAANSKDTRNRKVVSLTFAVGGNFDIAGALFGK